MTIDATALVTGRTPHFDWAVIADGSRSAIELTTLVPNPCSTVYKKYPHYIPGQMILDPGEWKSQEKLGCSQPSDGRASFTFLLLPIRGRRRECRLTLIDLVGEASSCCNDDEHRHHDQDNIQVP